MLSDPLASDSGCGGYWGCGGDAGGGRNTGCGGSVGCGADGSFRAIKLTCLIVGCAGDTVCGGNAGCSRKMGCGRDGSLSVGFRHTRKFRGTLGEPSVEGRYTVVLS